MEFVLLRLGRRICEMATDKARQGAATPVAVTGATPAQSLSDITATKHRTLGQVPPPLVGASTTSKG